MRHVVLLLLISTFSAGQEKPQPAPASLAGAPLVVLEKQMVRAERIGDWKFIEGVLASDFQEITPDGRLLTKSEVAEAFKTIHIDSLQADNFRVQMLRDEIGVVTYTVQASGTLGGKPLRVSAIASSTWRRQKDRWQTVFHQTTLLPQPPVSAAELEGLEQDLAARQSSRDAEWLKQIFADDAVIVGPDGKRSTKAEAIQSIVDTPAMATKLSDLSARAMGPDSGVVVSHVDVQSDRVLPYTVTTVWRRGPAGWQVISHQYTRIEK